jgi:hypothetical protein
MLSIANWTSLLSKVMTSVAVLSPIKLSVVILNVVAPQRLKSEINLSARERERVRESERVYEQRNDKNEKQTNTFFSVSHPRRARQTSQKC